jgi:hypothetical protein
MDPIYLDMGTFEILYFIQADYQHQQYHLCAKLPFQTTRKLMQINEIMKANGKPTCMNQDRENRCIRTIRP